MTALHLMGLPRPARAISPLRAPWQALVAVTDTNALGSQARHVITAGENSGFNEVFGLLAGTGRSNTFVAEHVPAELARRLSAIVGTKAPLAEVERVLWTQIMPDVPVVHLAVGDYLHPRTRTLLLADRTLPKGVLGDPDDLGTAALAEFLAPALVVSADSVFTRHGYSNTTALTWVSMTRRFLRAAGWEATVSDAASLAELAANLVFSGFMIAARSVRDHPLPWLLLAGAVLLAARFGLIDLDRWRRRLGHVLEAARPLLDQVGDAMTEHGVIRRELRVVEPYGAAHPAQAAARRLARCGQSLTPAELRDALRPSGISIPATVLKTTMTEHPAFHRAPGDRFTVGRMASPCVPLARQSEGS